MIRRSITVRCRRAPWGPVGAIALLAACGGARIETAPTEAAAALDTADLLRQHVEFLATGAEPRDWTHPAGLERSADYIAAQL